VGQNVCDDVPADAWENVDKAPTRTSGGGHIPVDTAATRASGGGYIHTADNVAAAKRETSRQEYAYRYVCTRHIITHTSHHHAHVTSSSQGIVRVQVCRLQGLQEAVTIATGRGEHSFDPVVGLF
jgi:hypothetical protein